MDVDSIFQKQWNDVSEGETAYARPSVAALMSTAFGLATFLVFMTPWFFFFGILAVASCGIALWNIRNSEGILTGTTFAYTGLCCAFVALVSVSVFWPAYQYGLRKEADQFFRLWFVAFQQDNEQEAIPQAMELHTFYANRSKASNAEEWWQHQYESQHLHRAVHRYVENELVRVLLALGEKAKVTYYKTLQVVCEPEYNQVSSVYAVTFPGELGGTETFFVRINGRRSYPPDTSAFQTAGWQIEGTPTLYVPE